MNRKDANGTAPVGDPLPHGPKRPIGLAKKPLPTEDVAKSGEAAVRFDPPGGWPDLAEALEEVEYYSSQGLDAEARRALQVLRQRHPGHPALASWMEPQPMPAMKPVDDLSASARLRLGDLADREIEAALEEFGPEEPAPIADFEDKNPNITGHTVIARNPLLMAPPSSPDGERLPGVGVGSVRLEGISPSAVTLGRRPLARTIVTPTLMPPKPYQGPGGEPPPLAQKPSRPATPPGGFPLGTAVYGASGPGVLPPAPPESLDIPLEVEIDDSDELAIHGGSVAQHPKKGAAARGSQVVHIQVIGSRGQVLAAFNLHPGQTFDVGRSEGKPWFEDGHLLPQHAQLIPAPGGGVLLGALPGGGAVYRQLESSERLSQGDQIRVGQSTVFYEATEDGYGRLHVQRNSRGAVDIVVITAGNLLLGRDHGDIVFASDTYVSSEHCRVLAGPTGVFLEDLGSSNGTYLRVRSDEQIPFGTLLLMGQTQFRVTAA